MNSDQISNLLTIVLIIMIAVLLILVIVYLVLRAKTKNPKKEKAPDDLITSKSSKSNKTAQTKTNVVTYNKQSIFSFMEFDKIEDNMIIRKNGNKFLMVIECQGVNYDLMSGLEKNSVEQGFIQFLNTLRYPIQIYVQTRTVNLESGITKYKERVNTIGDRLLRKQMEYNRKQNMGYSQVELNKAKLEVTREQNLYEYGIDLVKNTERMSLNRNILRKNYYVIIDYVPEDINTNNYGKDEIRSMAFSELYTKSQAIISALAVCNVNGKILDSNELAELLYIAYNRDDAEIYDLNKALNAGYDELYSTGEDVLQKRIKELDKKIERDAQNLANSSLREAMAESEEQKRAKEKEAKMDDLIKQMAQIIIDENQEIVGSDIAQKAKETAKQIYKILKCKDFARVDMFLTPNNEIYFNEINTIPGFTSHSRYPNMMKQIGMSFEELVDKLISLEV